MNKWLVLFITIVIVLSGCSNESESILDEEIIISVDNTHDQDIINEIQMVSDDKVSLLDGSTIKISIINLDEPGGNNPKKIKLEHNEYSSTLESNWNDGIHIKQAVLDNYTGNTEIFITILGTDISKQTNIYSCSGKEIVPNGRFEHFSDELYFDNKGNIYYSYDTDDLKELNYYYNYKTGKSGEVTSEITIEKLKVISANE